MNRFKRSWAAASRDGSVSDNTVVMSGRAIARQSLVYAIGSSVAVPVGIISIVVTTRFLSTTSFGHLAALMATAILFTHLGELMCLHGTLLSVYGVGGDGGDADDMGGDDIVSDELQELAATEGRRILGSGLLLCLNQNVVLCGIALTFAHQLDDLLIHVHNTAEVRFAILSGATGAVWTFVNQIYRVERRVVAHVVLSTVRPILVIIFTVIALAIGGGVLGVVIATGLANVAAGLIGLVFTFSHYHFRPQRTDPKMIYRKGARIAPILIIAYVRNNLDVLLLNQAASPHTLGLYGAASRISQIPLYFSTACLTAWAPMERSPIFRASRERIGRGKFAGKLFFYIIVINLVIFVLLSTGADLLIRLAAPSYAGAAAMIPWVSGATVIGAIFYASYRAAFFHHRLVAYTVLGGIGAALYAGGSIVLVPVMGVYAVPVVAIVVGMACTASMLLWDKRGEHTLDLATRPLLVATGMAVAAVAAAGPITHLLGIPEWLLAALAPVAFVGLLLVTGIVPRSQLVSLLHIARSLRGPTHDRKELMRRWPLLKQPERDAIAATVLGDPRPVSEVANEAGVPEAVIYARVTRGLRRLNGSSAVRPIDDRIGAYLLVKAPTFERDFAAIGLNEDGAPLEELYKLDDSYKALRTVERMRLHLRRRSRPSRPAPPKALTAGAGDRASTGRALPARRPRVDDLNRPRAAPGLALEQPAGRFPIDSVNATVP